MLKTPATPDGTPIEAFNQVREAIIADRSQFFKDLSIPTFLNKINNETVLEIFGYHYNLQIKNGDVAPKNWLIDCALFYGISFHYCILCFLRWYIMQAFLLQHFAR